ncbi:MAG: hypothetical protein HYZ59_06230 [Actinobacteria bacterium]|nr:hypothetical protein [Actinomycetota bacterium]
MAAPDYVPTDTRNRAPRVGLPMPPARRSTGQARPAALGSEQPVGHSLGRPGPDQGYALLLARSFEDRLVVTEGEVLDDVVAACVAVALKRASIFGRAPVVHDLEIAFTLFGFLGAAPPELVVCRRSHLAGAAHHHHRQRSVADAVPELTLAMTPSQIRASFPGAWRELLGMEEGTGT